MTLALTKDSWLLNTVEEPTYCRPDINQTTRTQTLHLLEPTEPNFTPKFSSQLYQEVQEKGN